MRRRTKQIVKYILSPGICMAMLVADLSGCGNVAGEADMTVKVATEAEKEALEEPEESEVSLTISQESFNVAFYLEVGESRKLAVDTDYDGTLTYASANDEVATIDTDGIVAAVKNGTATMTVTAGDTMRRINVIVKAPEEPEEEAATEETTEEETADSQTGTAATGTNTSVSGTVSGMTSGGTASAGTTTTTTTTAGTSSGNAASQPAAQPTEAAPAYNPADDYLDWYAIADQVNARLLADYPNAHIGQSTWYSTMNANDGYEGYPKTKERVIEESYQAIKSCLTDVDSTYTGNLGMVINGIEVNPDGSRKIYFTLNH